MRYEIGQNNAVFSVEHILDLKFAKGILWVALTASYEVFIVNIFQKYWLYLNSTTLLMGNNSKSSLKEMGRVNCRGTTGVYQSAVHFC